MTKQGYHLADASQVTYCKKAGKMAVSVLASNPLTSTNALTPDNSAGMETAVVQG